MLSLYCDNPYVHIVTIGRSVPLTGGASTVSTLNRLS